MDKTPPSGLKTSIGHNLPQIPTRVQNTRYAISKASMKECDGSSPKTTNKESINVVSMEELKRDDAKEASKEIPEQKAENSASEISSSKESVHVTDLSDKSPLPDIKNETPQRLIKPEIKTPPTPSTGNSPIKLRIRRSINNDDSTQVVANVSTVEDSNHVVSPEKDSQSKLISPNENSQPHALTPTTPTSGEIKRPRARTKRELKKQLMERRALIANPSMQAPAEHRPPPVHQTPPKGESLPAPPVPFSPSGGKPLGMGAQAQEAVSGQPLDTKFTLGDMLWGKVTGHPWWPCIVANDPFLGIFFRAVGLKKAQIHVQFFGDEDERGWVTPTSVMVYEGREAFEQFCNIMIEKDRKNRKSYEVTPRRKKPWLVAVKAADEAAKLTYEERITQFRLDYMPAEVPEIPVDEVASKDAASSSKNRKRRKSDDTGVKSPAAKRQRRESSTCASSESSEPLSPSHIKLPMNVENQSIGQFTVFCLRKREALKRKHPGYTVEQIDSILAKEYEALSDEQKSMFIPMGSDFTRLGEMMSKNMTPEAAPRKRPRQPKKKFGFETELTASQSSKRSKSLPSGSKAAVITTSADMDLLIDSVAKGSGEISTPDSLTLKVAAHSQLLGKNKKRLSKSERELEEGLITSESDTDVGRRKDLLAGAHYDLELLHLSSSWPYKKESVCHVCEEEGDLVTCEGGCCATYHPKCINLQSPVQNYKCPRCTSGIQQCFQCKEESSDLMKCAANHCGRYYHERCLKENTNSRCDSGSWLCPMHVCSTCMAENPKGQKARQGRLLRCLRCPTSYHAGDFCIAAGSKTLSGLNIVCANHYQSMKKTQKDHLHVSWCFVCSKGGMLVCCDTCPAAFHVECLDSEPPDGPWQCNQCSDGRKPLYGDIIWVKLGIYRWWPGEICHPKNVPLNIQAMPHQIGEFPVKFMGSHDYYWTSQGRVFLYQEGDRGGKCETVGSKHRTAIFKKAVEEATVAYALWQEVKGEKDERDNEKIERKPPAYKHVKANVPVGNVQSHRADLATISKCECTKDMEHPCGEDSDCLNRMTLYECHPQVCPAGEKCQNQRFQKREYPKSVPFRTDSRGWGLRCFEDIRKGQFVNEYVGELIDPEECERRIINAHENDVTNFYMLTLDNKRVIDAGPKGNLSRFMNHSCDPNLVTQIWTVNGDQRVGFFAIHDIPAGTELTFNYNLKSLGNEKTACHCQASNCSGFLGVRPKSATSDVEKTSKREKKKRRKRQSVKKLQDDDCYRCGDGGQLILCDQHNCPKAYHLKCLKLKALPKGRWLCPWHHCDECGQRALKLCSECPNSFCPHHIEGNIFQLPDGNLVCSDHEELMKAVASSQIESLKNQPDAVVSSSELSTEGSGEISSNPPSPRLATVAAAPAAQAVLESSDSEKMLKLPPKLGHVSDTESSSTDVSASQPLKKPRKSPSKRRSGSANKTTPSKPAALQTEPVSSETQVPLCADSDSSVEGRLTIVEDDTQTETTPKTKGQKRKRSSKSDTHCHLPGSNHSSPQTPSSPKKQRVRGRKSDESRRNITGSTNKTESPTTSSRKSSALSSKKLSPLSASGSEKNSSNKKGKSPVRAVFDDNSSDEFPDLVIDIP